MADPNLRHHTVRTVFAILIAQLYTVYIVANVIQGQLVPDGILLSGFVGGLIVLYKVKKGKGEEDRRSDESVL